MATPQQVRAVQVALTTFGKEWPGMDPRGVDGDFGTDTARAVHAFQRARGLLAEQGGPLQHPGTIGPTTLEALGVAITTAVEATAGAPPWYRLLEGVKGLHERTDNAELRAWLKSDGPTLGDPSKLPWCGDAVETAVRLTLRDEPFPGPLGENPYWARNWLHFGRKCGPVLGAVAVFSRGSGGHVGFVAGLSPDGRHVHVLGGNQSDRVSVMKLDVGRLLGYRWPTTYPLPSEVEAPTVSGGALSTDEA